MSQELKVTIYEPSKEPRSVSRDLDPEFLPLIDRGVIFNEDGSLCDEFEVFPEDLSEDEIIGFDLDVLTSDTVKFIDSLPPVPVKKQQKIDRFKKIKEVKKNTKMNNKLKKIRKKPYSIVLRNRTINNSIDFPQNPTPPNRPINKNSIDCRSNPTALGYSDNHIDRVANNAPLSKTQRKKFQKFANSDSVPRTISNEETPSSMKRKKKKKKAATSPADLAYPSQSLNPSKFPAFIRNSWRKKKPNNISRANNTSTNNNLDYIPIGNHNNQPQYQRNGYIPPLINTNRYFSLDNC
ncbi:hypothetical protein V9T40_012168 [Parthenolecanium corni]|uniref:Uncharacterized protein n=1 Tax=Parthenolecanium corni TaxID=536013 RepID=A0AAN9XZ31_9HEMI